MGIEFPGSPIGGLPLEQVLAQGITAGPPAVPAEPVRDMFTLNALSKGNQTNMLSTNEELRGELIWGASKSGKTTQLVAAVEWIVQHYHKGVLLITHDGGSLGELTAYVELGIVQVLPIARFTSPLACMDNVTTGMWPVNHNGIWTFKSKEANHQNDPSWYARFGMQVFESITSLGDFFSSWLAESPGAHIPQTPDRDKYFIKDDDAWRGFSAPSHIGEMHRLLNSWVHQGIMQKYARNIWTAREQRAEGQKGGMIIGPDAPGNKLTKKIASWFGGAYHTEAVPIAKIVDERPDVAAGSALAGLMSAAPGVQQLEYRMYITPHADAATGIMCDAGNRLPPSCAEVVKRPFIVCNVERDGDGNVTKRPGIQTMWDLEEKYKRRAVEKLREDDAVIKTMKALGLMKDVTEV